jgi:hypothetical protein
MAQHLALANEEGSVPKLALGGSRLTNGLGTAVLNIGNG